jgi:hypothetical protein
MKEWGVFGCIPVIKSMVVARGEKKYEGGVAA